MSEAIIVALITGGLALLGTCISNNKNAGLITYRLEQLEEKVNKHNQVIERTYALEQRAEVMEERQRVANHRIADLEAENQRKE